MGAMPIPTAALNTETKPSKMEVYHHDIKDIIGHNWPHEMIKT